MPILGDGIWGVVVTFFSFEIYDAKVNPHQKNA